MPSSGVVPLRPTARWSGEGCAQMSPGRGRGGCPVAGAPRGQGWRLVLLGWLEAGGGSPAGQSAPLQGEKRKDRRFLRHHERNRAGHRRGAADGELQTGSRRRGAADGEPQTGRYRRGAADGEPPTGSCRRGAADGSTPAASQVGGHCHHTLRVPGTALGSSAVWGPTVLPGAPPASRPGRSSQLLAHVPGGRSSSPARGCLPRPHGSG